jgi:ribosomal protein S12 methylthiotransferase accessory factor
MNPAQAWFARLGLSTRIGLIGDVRVQRVTAESPPWWRAIAACGMADWGDPQGEGIGADADAAVLAAVTDAIERYCLRAVPGGLPWAAPGQLTGRCLSAADWPMFSPAQYDQPGFPYEPLDDRPRHWTLATSLADDTPMWVPASLVWQHAELPGGALTGRWATGTAAAPVLEQAIVGSLYEALRCDAAMIVRQSRAIGPRIDPAADWQHPQARALALRARASGLRLLLRDITSDAGVPTALAVIRDLRTRPPVLAAGSACRAAMPDAAWAALAKAFDGLCRARANPAAARGVSGAEHLLAETPVETPPRLSAFSLRTQTPQAELRAAARAVLDAGYEPLWLDLTTSDVADLGFHVGRVLVPGLVPPVTGEWCHLANPRVCRVPRQRGWPHSEPGATLTAARRLRAASR